MKTEQRFIFHATFRISLLQIYYSIILSHGLFCLYPQCVASSTADSGNPNEIAKNLLEPRSSVTDNDDGDIQNTCRPSSQLFSVVIMDMKNNINSDSIVHFAVDSTIKHLTIEIDGDDAFSVDIDAPSGMPLVRGSNLNPLLRKKREENLLSSKTTSAGFTATSKNINVTASPVAHLSSILDTKRDRNRDELPSVMLQSDSWPLKRSRYVRKHRHIGNEVIGPPPFEHTLFDNKQRVNDAHPGLHNILQPGLHLGHRHGLFDLPFHDGDNQQSKNFNFNYNDEHKSQLQTTQQQEQSLSSPQPTNQRSEIAVYEEGQNFYINGQMRYISEKPPLPGVWGFIIRHPRVSVKISAIGAITFRFQLLDLDTEEPTTRPPVAGEVASARIEIDDVKCITDQHICINFYTEHNTILMARELPRHALLTDNYPLEIFFRMPALPFYPVLKGFDTNGFRFRRRGSTLIVPKHFVISMTTRHTAERLFPGIHYNFGVDIENKACLSSIFNTTAVVKDSKLFQVITTTVLTEIPLYSGKQVVVSVKVLPEISFIVESTLTIEVTCEKQKQALEESLTAYPAIFEMDFEAPTFGILEKSGMCNTSISCDDQYWDVVVSIVDKLTGVENVTIDSKHESNEVRPIEDHVPGIEDHMDTLYNRDVISEYSKFIINVKYSGSGTDRSAEITYRSNCCHMLLCFTAVDYANNHEKYRIMAPLHTKADSTNTPSTSNSTSTMKDTTPPIKETIPDTQLTTPRMKIPVTEERNTTPAVLITFGVKRETTSTVVAVAAKGKEIEDVPNDTWSGSNFSVLRIIALTLGCIGGLAGIAIVIICLLYVNRKRLAVWWRKRSRHRQNSRERRGSDITMGSSWESRSRDGSIEASSSGGTVRSDFSFFSDISDDGARELRSFKEQNGEYIGSMYDKGRERNRDTQRAEETNLSVGASKECGVRGRGSDLGSASGDSSLNVSARLRQGGYTYVSMMEIQKRMEEIERLQQEFAGLNTASYSSSSEPRLLPSSSSQEENNH